MNVREPAMTMVRHVIVTNALSVGVKTAVMVVTLANHFRIQAGATVMTAAAASHNGTAIVARKGHGEAEAKATSRHHMLPMVL